VSKIKKGLFKLHIDTYKQNKIVQYQQLDAMLNEAEKTDI